MKKIGIIVLIFAIIISMLSSCSGSGGSSEDYSKMPVVKADGIGEDVVKANSDFAFKILKSAYENGKNIFISPASISAALAMTYNGANGETKEEMAKVLEFVGLDDATVNEGFAYLVQLLNKDKNGVMINMANSIWIRNDLPVLEKFKEINKQYFAAMISNMDFSDPTAKDTINDWVKKNTKGLIESIIDDKIAPDSVMYLINTIYFKGQWKVEFDPESTYEEDFKINGKAVGKIDMMSSSRNIEYYADKEYQMATLNYKDDRVVMDFILPRENVKMDDFIKDFDTKKYNEAISKMYTESDVLFRIPKFKNEYKLSLRDALIELGMKKAFSGSADFSKMVSTSVAISDVKHKSYIEVNEEGTEAAAVTSVEMKLTAMPSMEKVEFIADRPFIYVIRDKETNSILFSGVFNNPTE